MLIAGGGLKQGTTEDTAEIFDPETDRFEPAGNMDAARVSHRTVLLNDGRVMVIGGAQRTGPYDTVEFYNPATETWVSDPFLGSWEKAPPLVQSRAGHTTTLLDGGDLLIAGGRARLDESDIQTLVDFIPATEIYNPSTGESRAVMDMNDPRGGHIAAGLPGGRVLVAGGRQLVIDEEENRKITFIGTAEIYDPADDTWTQVADMTVARWAHTGIALADGTVMVVGGENDDSGPTVEVYDFSTRTWSLLPNLDQRLRDAAVGVLQDGTILVAGGFGSQGPSNSALVHVLGTTQWEYVDRLPEARVGSTMTLLDNGGVLMLGGTGTTKAWIFDGTVGGWLYGGKMFDSRRDHTATLLPDGRVITIGGEARNRAINDSVEIYTPPQ